METTHNNPNVTYLVFGSHLYGLNTNDSDTDYKGVSLCSYSDTILNKCEKNITTSTGDDASKNKAGDIDFEVFSLPEFIRLALECQTVAIDMLHANETISSSPEWKFLVKNRTKFYTKRLNSFLGYVTTQAKKYGIKGSKINIIKDIIDTMSSTECVTIGDMHKKEQLIFNQYAQLYTHEKNDMIFYEVCGRKLQFTLTVKEALLLLTKIYNNYGERAKLAASNHGIDWKAVSHALRAGYQAKEIYKTGDFSYPLAETEFLLDVKLGKLDFTTIVQPELELLVDEVTKLAGNSEFRETPDVEYWENWLATVIENHRPKRHDEQLLEAVNDLNDVMFDDNDELLFDKLLLSSDGNVTTVDFMGNQIFNTEDNDAAWNNKHNNYENIHDHLKMLALDMFKSANTASVKLEQI